MEETWRMSMGMPGIPRRSSMEEEEEEEGTAGAGPTRRSVEALEPEDFVDVFGGPPRSVLSRKFSGEFATPSSVKFYEEVFRQPEFGCSSRRGGGRSLPGFRIPARGGGFYSDVFGSEGEEEGRRSRERSRPNSKGKSKSNSSSVLSSEELSPLRRPTAGDDPALSSFASKLRPINVPCRWNSTTMGPEDQLRRQGMPSFKLNPPTCTNNHFMENGCNDKARRSCFKVPRLVSSPETISLEPVSYRSFKASVDDLELNSPSSPVSSLCEEQEAMAPVGCNLTQEEMEEEEDEEVMSSYVIEINSNRKEGSCEAVSIDEAIAWAKEKFQAHSFERQHEKDHSAKHEERPKTHESIEQQVEGHGRMQSPKMKLEALDDDLKLWSAGKENNIRLLLSDLHDILWPNSGWLAIPLTSLIDSSQVKKAYQKARLCLHPDKLQQRGATTPQKYVAEKAFSILQDAWAKFISQDFFN